MMVKPPADAPILSRPVAVDDIADRGLAVAVETTAAEREALRAFNGLVAVTAATGAFVLRRQGRTGVAVTGEVLAAVVQTCVVSLEPFEATVREPVEMHFLSPEALDAWRAERARHPADPDDPGEADEPDAIEDGRIDLGVVTAEHLTLGLDPYPKKPGVRFEEVAPSAAQREESPFAALKALRPDDA